MHVPIIYGGEHCLQSNTRHAKTRASFPQLTAYLLSGNTYSHFKIQWLALLPGEAAGCTKQFMHKTVAGSRASTVPYNIEITRLMQAVSASGARRGIKMLLHECLQVANRDRRPHDHTPARCHASQARISHQAFLWRRPCRAQREWQGA